MILSILHYILELYRIIEPTNIPKMGYKQYFRY
nr:MAG TPA: hypothetical protein [Caudoviricetes sp.]